MKPFATVEDYTARYGEPADAGRVSTLLADATDLICSELDRAELDYSDPTESFTRRLARVCCEVVHRSVGDGSAADIPFGATQFSQTSGSYTRTASFANPTGDLYLTRQDRRALGIGRMRACVVSACGGGGGS